MSGLLLFACLCWAGFQTGINRAQQVGIDMATSIETLNAEVKTLSNTLEELSKLWLRPNCREQPWQKGLRR